MSTIQGRGEYVLGLDIGAASIGWALVELQDGKPAGLAGAGVRVFAAGMEGDISAGRDESRATKRREARLRRRQLARRRQRLMKLLGLLQEGGLLPPGDVATPEALTAYFARLDGELFPASIRRDDPHLYPYRLRARALEEKLTPHEVGRALYHLSQRRGFLSNRKATTRQREEEGEVKKQIGQLQHDMDESGARTLGEYLSRQDPEVRRVRDRYLSRAMVEHEFDSIWQAQAAHHPELLTEALRKAVHYAIFFQRPLKTPKHLIGFCDLERDRQRAPLAALACQRHRLLQKVNDLRLVADDGQSRPLTREERTALAAALETKAEMTFGAIRRLLSLRGGRFNFEFEGEKGLIGNRTAAKLVGLFGEERWEALAAERRDQVVEDLHSIQSAPARRRRAEKAWGLDPEAATRFADLQLEDGHHSLSRQALARVLPLMEQGVPYATARLACYPDRAQGDPRDLLPPLADVMEVRNPTVERALTELRKVINAVVRQHGKPTSIRIELARDLKRNRKQRQSIHARNVSNRRDREEANREIIAAAVGVSRPTRDDEEKWLLWQECNGHCPYTGRPISMQDLFGEHPQFDVEHIIPFARSLDNSFLNKTLCCAEENRRRKRNRTPWEAYGGSEQWEDIIGRVTRFRGARGRRDNPKLERFQRQEVANPDDFASQQLNDTRYASRLAVRYVGQLYGAGADGVDLEGRRRVQAGRGEVTAYLREVWELNSLLGGGEKTRNDHRQHAVDAVVIALTDQATVKRLSEAAARAPEARRRRFAPVPPPWESCAPEVRQAVTDTVVSHRVSRKVAGAMHEETFYGRARPDDEGRLWAHVRKPISALAGKDVASIVDPTVRRCVEEALEARGENDPKEAFKSVEDHPKLRTREGREVPIHKVRLRVPVTTHQVGAGARLREVKLGSNHHVEVVETSDAKGRTKWEGVVVSTYEAMRRLKEGRPVVQREHGPGKRFVFSLAGGEVVELDARNGAAEATRALYVVRTVAAKTGGDVEVALAAVNDARRKADLVKDRAAWRTARVNALRGDCCRKVLVTPLGEVRDARD